MTSEILSSEEFPAEYQGKVFVTLFGPLVNPRFEGFVSPKEVVITFEDEEGGGPAA